MKAPPGIELADGWWEDLQRLWSHPPRAYHSVDHLMEVLEHWEAVDRHALWADRPSSFVALCLHDAIYVPGAKDNEERSADLVAEWTRRWCPVVDVPWTEQWIRLTARHGALGDQDLEPHVALLLDCDMAILGAEPERYRQYEDQVRQEYQHVPGPLYRMGRKRFLKKVLERPIYHSGFWSERLEARARENLEWALSVL